MFSNCIHALSSTGWASKHQAHAAHYYCNIGSGLVSCPEELFKICDIARICSHSTFHINSFAACTNTRTDWRPFCEDTPK